MTQGKTPASAINQPQFLTFVCLCSAGGALLLCLKFGGWVSFGVLALALLAGASAGVLYARSTPDGRMEQRRRRRERDFMQRAIDAMPEPVFVKNQYGQLIMVNRAYCRQRQLSREDILGRSTSSLMRDQALAAIVDSEDEAVLLGDEIHKEECITHPITGDPLHQIVTKTLSHDEDGQPVIIGCYFDITPLRRAERTALDALDTQTRQRDFLQVVFDAVPIPLFVKSTEHRYIMSNLAHARYEGVARQHIIGRRAGDFVGREVGAELEAEEERLLVSPPGTVFETERESQSPGGSTRFAILRDTVATDPSGRPVIIGALTELTAQRHAEARWKFALEGAGDGLWDWDIANDQTYYSPRWKAMQGFGDDEITEAPEERTRRVHPDDLEAAQAALDAHLQGIAPIYICELRQMGRHGEYLWMLDRGQVVERAADGRPLRMIGIYTDITSRKQVEEELRRHRNELRDLVTEQTHDLRIAKDAAEHANEAKTQFLTNMSHELRTPMHAVLSFASLGEERLRTATPEKIAGYFQRIRESGERLHQLLSNLLDLSRLDAGNMVLRLHRVDFAEIVCETLREFEDSLQIKSLHARLETRVSQPGMIGDALRLGQVVRNLLANAIQYSPEGSQIVLTLRHMRFTQSDAPGLELVIADEGIGIPTNELERVFDKFEQSSRTRSNAGGTGLGLPICREIILCHHGQIFARQRPEGGSEFVVQVPLAPPTVSLPARQAA